MLLFLDKHCDNASEMILEVEQERSGWLIETEKLWEVTTPGNEVEKEREVGNAELHTLSFKELT